MLNRKNSNYLNVFYYSSIVSDFKNTHFLFYKIYAACYKNESNRIKLVAFLLLRNMRISIIKCRQTERFSSNVVV